ncbi:MAG: hypothetical protein HUJ31_14220 [Pseudomonadales bacterium]|nr:hypothetical protein [Pseudomonadales bacterium]
MKVFVPVSDRILGIRSQLSDELVPFDPEFLVARNDAGEGRKPANWIVESDNATARARLRQSQLTR